MDFFVLVIVFMLFFLSPLIYGPSSGCHSYGLVLLLSPYLTCVTAVRKPFHVIYPVHGQILRHIMSSKTEDVLEPFVNRVYSLRHKLSSQPVGAGQRHVRDREDPTPQLELGLNPFFTRNRNRLVRSNSDSSTCLGISVRTKSFRLAL